MPSIQHLLPARGQRAKHLNERQLREMLGVSYAVACNIKRAGRWPPHCSLLSTSTRLVYRPEVVEEMLRMERSRAILAAARVVGRG